MVDEKKQRAAKARWIKTTKSKRKVHALKAAHARWEDADVRVAEHPGKIELAGFELACAVLDDGTRVFSERGVSAALGHARHPDDYGRKLEAKAKGELVLPGFMSETVANHLPNATRKKLANPIRYRMQKGFGIPALGFEATLLADVCEAYLAAREDGTLPHEELGKAKAADRLIRALARVALIALIDEATGFQVVRDRDELQRLLAKYVSEEHHKWAEKFPNEFYVELFRLRNIKTADVRKRPRYFGKLTNDLVYARLLPGILPKLDEVNPANEMGYRARKHHQHLVEQGAQHLTKHMMGLVYLMRSSANWADFMKALDRAAPIQVQEVEEKTDA